MCRAMSSLETSLEVKCLKLHIPKMDRRRFCFRAKVGSVDGNQNFRPDHHLLDEKKAIVNS